MINIFSAICQYISICGSNSRTRSWSLGGYFQVEDPCCYRENREIGIEDNQDRLEVKQWSGKKTQTVTTPETKASA